uniref:Uncharacterized protein n=1 Tax=Knipowitschia caucasica TaxID=637954 RepID=A0AAV2KVN8_KNICA
MKHGQLAAKEFAELVRERRFESEMARTENERLTTEPSQWGALLKFLSLPIENATSSQAKGCDGTSEVNSRDPPRSSQSSSQFETDCTPLLHTTSTSTTPAEDSSSTSPAKDSSTPPEYEGCDGTAEVNSRDPARSRQSSSQFETDPTASYYLHLHHSSCRKLLYFFRKRYFFSS